MTYQISLKLKPETYQRFADIHQQLNAGETQSLAKALGEVLADISCEVVDQVFGDLARLSTSGDGESERVLQQIVDTLRKYMPWSVSLFSNDRLTPVVNYLEHMMSHTESTHLLSYPVEKSLVNELLACTEQMKKGNNRYVAPALNMFTQIVDEGVTRLVRQPKKMLKFNLVVDKSLNGVINLTTQLGYKRFDRLGHIYDAQTMSQYFDHFLTFLNDQSTH